MIKNKYKLIKAELEKWNHELKALQEYCNHSKENVVKKHKSNTGNYDPSSNSHWIDFECLDCGKKWTEFY